MKPRTRAMANKVSGTRVPGLKKKDILFSRQLLLRSRRRLDRVRPTRQGYAVKQKPKSKKTAHSSISLFSGALGLDLGLEAAGFPLRLALEKDHAAVETIRLNKKK